MILTTPVFRRVIVLVALVGTIVLLSLRTQSGDRALNYVSDKIKEATHGGEKEKGIPTPKYKPTPTVTYPLITDPFPLLTTSTPPPIPKWNVPRKDLHKEYDLPVAPPLLIGFTRTYPILLQAVVSYITAGWPPEQIYVVENTGVQQANARGKLSLQNPFFLNHTALAILGVNVIQTPVLLNFAQLQNFYLSLSHTYSWPYYFWSHMDVLVLSYEDGSKDAGTPRYNQPGYKTVYELGCKALKDARDNDPRWAIRFFAYDHLALVNPAAYEEIGGWDTLIPYYMTDCDMHARLAMEEWTMLDRRAGVVTDVGVALENLLALYRVPGIKLDFKDPTLIPEVEGGKAKKDKRAADGEDDAANDENLKYWRELLKISERMFHHKHGSRGRLTWQQAARGGKAEPFYYDPAGLAEGIDVITEAGREVFRRKWGHRDCDLIKGGGLKTDDQWKVLQDWD